MKKSFKKLTAAILALLMLMTTLMLSPVTAGAATTATPVQLESCKIAVWADPENVLTQSYINDFNNSTSKTSALGGVQPFQITGSGTAITDFRGSGNYYLFLPSNADCSALKLWVADGTTLSINNIAIQSGVPTNVFESLNAGGVSQEYTFKLNSSSYKVTVMKSGNVGTVYIDTASGSLENIWKSKENFETGTIMVVQPDGTVDYMGSLEKMSGRGNGTWNSDNNKNPYNIKLAKSTSLLGMGKAKKWCLLASTGSGNDNTFVKNQLAYDFADYIGIANQVHCKPVDLYANQQYLGSYQLAEKVEIKSNRVSVTDAYENLEIANGTTDPVTGAIVPADLTGTEILTRSASGSTLSTSKEIEKKTTQDFTNAADHTVGARRYSNLTDPGDYTGGYLYELEISNRWVTEGAGFCAYNRQGWVIKSADYASKNMVDYSYDLLYALGSAVYNNGTVINTSKTTNCSDLTTARVPTILNKSYHGAKSITNPAPSKYQGAKWSDLLDADSAVKYYWTQEFFKNMDSSTSSTYFYKDYDNADGTLSKLIAGPVWDMDNAMLYNDNASRWGASYTSTNNWYTKECRMYRWRCNDSDMGYSTDTKSPRNFYGALATNCPDFWEMAQLQWFSVISPAVDILLGKKTDETGTLKSIAEYVGTVEKSGQMDAARFAATYDSASITSGLTNWVSNRQTWINTQFSTISISDTLISTVPAQYYTGNEIKPEIVITYSSVNLGPTILKEGVDYTVSYTNNINVGTATAIITGINGFTGTTEVKFSIVANPLEQSTLTIESNAYTNILLSAALTDANGNDITDLASYQWYKNNTAISGANEKTYLTAPDDANSLITVKATGDGKSLTGSVESNACNVLSGNRPEGFSRTIASWDYDYTADMSTLVNSDTTGNTFTYAATGGESPDGAKLYGTVTADEPAQIKWSGKSDLYTNSSGTTASDRAPVMGTSKSEFISWGQYPYFETVVSTEGYENITFSAKLGGTNKGPKNWKLQYSLDGSTFTDIENAAYSITANKTMETAFNDISLPADCDNQSTVYIRMIVTQNLSIGGSTILNQMSGDAAVNNIKVCGASLSVVTSLYAPTITTTDNGVIFSDDTIAVTDNNGGADIYYTVNGGEPVKYSGAVNVFDNKTAKIGDTATINAYAAFNDVVSDTTSCEVTFGGVNINSFSYNTYSEDVTGGAVQSSGGVYGESGKMTAYTDGKAQYVPLWREDNGSFSIAPDDGAKWSENSGFTYTVSTAGFENIGFSCKAYTTNSGPKSITLQYSTDGINFYTVRENTALNANKMLEQVFLNAQLPAACDNQRILYIRLITSENLTFIGTALHNNESKGNLYVNDVIVSGEDNGAIKMPYTNKSTNYFGELGVIEYISPDGLPMRYVVKDSENNTVLGGTYPSTGIQLSTAAGFNKDVQEPYTILIEAVGDTEENEASIANSGTYYYKGETLVKFNYNSTTKLFENYVSADKLSVNNSSGTNTGKLSMYPNGKTATVLDYTGTYGVKASWNVSNPFVSNKTLNKVDGNGFWLIETSTAGYKDLTLNLEQISSNKGPRDWGIAYSTDGKNFTYLDNSNARAISNDAGTLNPVETYGNIPLDSVCDNQEKLYIKIFINGGESVDGTELDDPSIIKGNTGINGIEINGIGIPVNVEFNTTLLESIGAQNGSINVPNVDIYVNGELKATTDSNAVATVPLSRNTVSTIEFRGEGIAARTITLTADAATPAQNISLMAYDVNADGYVNAKDYAIINKNSQYSSYKEHFDKFINVKTDEFTY